MHVVQENKRFYIQVSKADLTKDDSMELAVELVIKDINTKI